MLFDYLRIVPPSVMTQAEAFEYFPNGLRLIDVARIQHAAAACMTYRMEM